MNKFIADAFGFILTLWHLIVLVILGVILYFGYTGDVITPFEPYFSPEAYPYAAMAIFFLHVLIMGVLSIMVSIHEQLSAVRKILTEKLEMDTDAREIHLNPDT